MPSAFPYLAGAPPLAFAHRGGAAGGDENTAAAFARAVLLGYRYVETDVHATADGVPVVFHDATLERLTGEPGRVAGRTWADLAALRVGGAAAIPRLDEVLHAWPEVRFNIDVKADAAVEPAVATVRRAGAGGRVLFASFDDARLARIRALTGGAVATSVGARGVARLWRGAMLAVRRPRLPDCVVAAQVPVRFRGLRVVTPRFVRHAHRLGLQVHVWTVDEPAEMHELLNQGVDGIMTDHPDVLRDVYASRGHWPPD